MSLSKDFAIFINTTDSFEDCWNPFFKLFKTYWPDYKGRIYLNTEKKSFLFEGLNILSIQNQIINGKWTDCLLKGLGAVKEKYIIYMQEDYFLHNRVITSEVKKFFNLFIESDLDCLHLTDQSTSGPFNNHTIFNEIWEILPEAEYRISTQAAFWNKHVLINYLKPGQSGWEFERKSGENLEKQPAKIYCVSHEIIRKGKNEILPYVFTGIIKGKWNKEVKKVFKENGIVINYSKRGFFQENIIIRNVSRILKL